MDLRHFLFSFEGRISRAQWWLFSIPYALFVSLLYLSQSEGFASSDALKDRRCYCDFDCFNGRYVHVVGRKCEAMP